MHPPPSPARANFTLMTECTPESSGCNSVYSVWHTEHMTSKGEYSKGRSQIFLAVLNPRRKMSVVFLFLFYGLYFFVEEECTLYSLQTRGNIIIALECVKFWLPQVPSFHKLFKSLPPTNKEKVAENKKSVFYYDYYHGVPKKCQLFLPIFDCK